MYENMKDNVVQKISQNKLPFILLIIVLIIIIIVVVYNDYISFSKNNNNTNNAEGFDIPSNIPINLPPNIPVNNPPNYPPDYPPNNPPNNPPDYPPNNPPNYPPDYPPNNPPNNPPNDLPDIPPDLRDKVPDKYKDEYDKYKDEYDKYKKKYEELNKLNKDLKNFNPKNELKKYASDYGNMIKNEMKNIVDNEKIKQVQNVFSNVNVSIPLINNPKVSNSLIVISFIFIIILLCFIFLPSFKEFKNLFNQISNVTYVILYTIFIILFFRLLPSNILNSKANYIVPITIIIAVFLFILSFRSNYIYNFNVNYERIKMVILYFCFITLCITYYTTNPGKYITNNFNISLLLSALIGLFGFLYLIVLLTLPNIYKPNGLEKLSFFSKYGGIGFILFLVIMSVVITKYPDTFFKNTTTSIIIFPLLFMICLIWSILLITNVFSADNEGTNKGLMSSNIAFIKKALLTVFGLTISGIIIAYIVYIVQNFSGKSNIASFILSIFLIISILTLIYKTVFVKLPSHGANKAKDGFFNLIVNLIFYIPCLFSGIFDFIMKSTISEYNSNTTGNVLILFIILGLLLLYIFLPSIQRHVNLQGGKQLVENPVYTNNLYSLANYEELNGSDKFDYQYAISFWVYLDSLGSNTSSSYNKYTSLLDFGGKPNVLYKADENTLLITMDQEELPEKSKNKLLEFDDNGNRIIYKNKNMLLQKWNNIIINYNGGTLDVFLNGELVQSSIEVLPYMKLDMLTIGSDNGIHGGICNVIYFKNPLTMSNIYNIYNTVKNKTPPVTNNSNKTIISIH